LETTPTKTSKQDDQKKTAAEPAQNACGANSTLQREETKMTNIGGTDCKHLRRNKKDCKKGSANVPAGSTTNHQWQKKAAQSSTTTATTTTSNHRKHEVHTRETGCHYIEQPYHDIRRVLSIPTPFLQSRHVPTWMNS
jgi:hypothetical protein